jgi:hypothetical protein
MRLQTTARTSSLSESFKTALQFYSSEYSGDGCDLVFKEQPKENMNDATSPPRTTQIERDDYNKEESLQSWIKRQARKRSVDEIVVMAGERSAWERNIGTFLKSVFGCPLRIE